MNVLTPPTTLRERLRPFAVALAAGVGYGGWAAFVHRHLGGHEALWAGCTQAALSTPTTLTLAMVLEHLFRWPSSPIRGFWLAALGTWALAISWLVAGHSWAGTPHIAASIMPSVIIGGLFDFAYAHRLLALARRESDRAQPVPNEETTRRAPVTAAASAGLSDTTRAEWGGISGSRYDSRISESA